MVLDIPKTQIGNMYFKTQIGNMYFSTILHDPLVR